MTTWCIPVILPPYWLILFFLSHLMQRERKLPVLVGITVLFVVHVSGFYWCYKNGDLIRPLVMLPPKEIPPFWHAIFIILVNGMVLGHIYIVCMHTGMLAKRYCGIIWSHTAWTNLVFVAGVSPFCQLGFRCSLCLYLTYMCTCLLQIVWLFIGCKWVICPLYFNIAVTLYPCNHQYCITVFKVIFLFLNNFYSHASLIFCRYNGAPNCYDCQMFAADVLQEQQRPKLS